MLAFFYVLIQWTYGFAQNLLGLFVFLWQKLRHRAPSERYRYAMQTGWNRRDGLSLGMFTFIPRSAEDDLKSHEYGHTLQSLILGPLYLPVIAVPSFLWANTRLLSRTWKSGKKSYYSFYPERWANRLADSADGLRNGRRTDNESETI